MLNHLTALITREVRCFKREVELFPDDDALWQTLPGITNPAGTLALHACGNLRHYVGHHLGGDDYVRDRPAEFSARGVDRKTVASMLEDTAALIERVLPNVTTSQLEATYPEQIGGVTLNTERFLLHLATHLAMHLGQAGYLRRALTGDNTSAGPVSIQAIAEA